MFKDAGNDGDNEVVKRRNAFFETGRLADDS